MSAPDDLADIDLDEELPKLQAIAREIRGEVLAATERALHARYGAASVRRVMAEVRADLDRLDAESISILFGEVPDQGSKERCPRCGRGGDCA